MSKWENKIKSIEEYMSLPYRMEIEPDSDEGGFVVSFPELPGCISSGGDIQQAVANAKDAQKHGLRLQLKTEFQ
nr:type II toxin-antitoxin system HicB family antitoxin [uncultured Treponema sp.]